MCSGEATVHGTPMWNDHWAALEIGRRGEEIVLVMRFLVTHAIITTRQSEPYYYANRWCYKELSTAVAIAQRWLRSGGEEPEGWHRHPDSGRRRDYGEGGRLVREYVWY